MKRALALGALLLAGCLTHIGPDRDAAHLRIVWHGDFEAAKRASLASGRPVLSVLVAGDITEHC